MTQPPLYRYEQTFEVNSAGPTDVPEPVSPEVVAAGSGRSLLGYPVGYPIGVPASPLTANSTWVAVCSGQGFNVITYKTVRLRRTSALPPPNWLFVDGLDAPLTVGEPVGTVRVDQRRRDALGSRSYSMVNSFGIPSEPLEDWQQDIRRASATLRSGQLLIVSVVGDYETLFGRALVDDFVAVALAAEAAGAAIVELNLSCPNTVSGQGPVQPPICESPADTDHIVSSVREALDSGTRLVVKLGYLPRLELEQVMDRIGSAVDGVSGINTLQVRVEDADGAPAFWGTRTDADQPREKAGLSGIAIRDYALDFVRSLALLRRTNQWTFEIIAMGGVMEAHDVRALIAVGADAVQTATAVANNPDLPRQLCNDHHPVPSEDERLVGLIGAALLDPRWDFRTLDGLARQLRLPTERIRQLLNSHPEVARESVMSDHEGKTLYASRTRSPSLRERLERIRWILAR